MKKIVAVFSTFLFLILCSVSVPGTTAHRNIRADDPEIDFPSHSSAPASQAVDHLVTDVEEKKNRPYLAQQSSLLTSPKPKKLSKQELKQWIRV